LPGVFVGGKFIAIEKRASATSTDTVKRHDHAKDETPAICAPRGLIACLCEGDAA
jgi:hypothetical protein